MITPKEQANLFSDLYARFNSMEAAIAELQKTVAAMQQKQPRRKTRTSKENTNEG